MLGGKSKNAESSSEKKKTAAVVVVVVRDLLLQPSRKIHVEVRLKGPKTLRLDRMSRQSFYFESIESKFFEIISTFNAQSTNCNQQSWRRSYNRLLILLLPLHNVPEKQS